MGIKLKIIKWIINIKKGAGIISTFIGLNKYIFIAGGVVVAFILAQQYRINSQGTTISTQKLEIVKNDITIKKLTKSNAVTAGSLVVCLSVNTKINEDLTDAEGKNEAAVQNLKEIKVIHDERINKIKEDIKPVTVCDNADIDDDFTKRMREN